ncbi:MAG: hypothetical protein JWN73_905 [Betaproteobacteria bacterium]|nr:hypothetical protein [Betaproteobacteria bacterium]
MAEDHFEPPRAPLKDIKEPPRQRSNLLAIIIGALVDFVSTQISTVVILLVFAIAAGASGTPLPDLQTQLSDSDVLFAIGSAVGLSCSVLGGYVCARFANQNEYANGLACGFVGVISGELMYPADTSMLMHLFGLLTIPACVLGAHIKMRRQKTQERAE